MSPAQKLRNLLKRLEKKKREVTLEIRLLTAWIGEHHTLRPLHFETPLSHDSSELRSWRKVSYRLHQRRSELKTKLENIQIHLRTVTQQIEEMDMEFFYFPVFSDIHLESEPVSAGA